MATPITKVSGVGDQTAEILVENGFESAEVLAAAKEEDLLKISGFGPSKAKKFIEAAQALVGTDAVVEPPVSEEAAKVDKTEAVSESGAEAETTENNAEMPIGPKVCTQKFSQKAKKKKGKGTKAKKKKKKSSRKKKSK